MRVRLLTLIAMLASLVACGGPGYVRAPLPADADLPPSDAGADTVWLVAVDGLRADQLRRYLRTLRREYHEPRWRSGISMLKRAGKRLVRAQNAAASIETGRGALATLLTGFTAQVHGQPASAWIASPDQRGVGARISPGGVATTYDTAVNVDRYFVDGLRVPTLFEALPAVRAASIFMPFAAGRIARFTPARDEDLSAWLDDATREHATPLVDRAARHAAVDLIQSDTPPNLLVLGLRAPHGPIDQQAALRALDGELAALVSAQRRAHPERLARTHLILVGTSPTTALGRHPRAFTPDAVRARLTELVPECRVNFSPARVRVVPAGRTARLYIAPTKANHTCLNDALRAARLHASAWLDGAAWQVERRTRVWLSDRVEDDLGAIHSRRLEERLTLAAGGALGDALIFAAPTITFDESAREAEGGVRPDAVVAPLLILSAAISDATADELVSAPIELTDIAPTLVHLLGGAWPASESTATVERRAPLLTRRDDQWVMVPAARLERAAAKQTIAFEPAPAMSPFDFGAPAWLCVSSASGGVPALALDVSARDGVGYLGLHWDSRYAHGEQREERLLMTLLPRPLDAEDQGSTRVLAEEPRPSVKMTVAVDEMSARLAQLRRMGPIGPRQPRSDLLARFGETPATIPLRDAFLTLIACDAFDRCQRKPLLTDRDFEALARSCR